MEKSKVGLTASTLKWIAICSMLIDHFAVAIYLQLDGYDYTIYRAMRYIGRIAFPIYCFLLVEGFFHTRNIKKYIGRCFGFALLSEIPFDLALYGEIFHPKSQNVYFTLTLGLCTLYLLEKMKGYDMLHVLARAVCILVGAGLAQVLETDYHYRGVLFIVMFYFCRNMDKLVRNIIGAVAFSYEVTAPLAFIPIYLYNGERGMRLKYFFYLVYPVHLLIYGLIRVMVL